METFKELENDLVKKPSRNWRMNFERNWNETLKELKKHFKRNLGNDLRSEKD